MTTFTTEDRENAFGVTINVEPIPFAGWVNTAPPHVVDSGASVMEVNNKLVAYINKDDGLVCAKCYKPFTKELTNMEIMDIGDKYLVSAFIPAEALEFARAILRKAQEK